jgi:hypothetical protein
MNLTRGIAVAAAAAVLAQSAARAEETVQLDAAMSQKPLSFGILPELAPSGGYNSLPGPRPPQAIASPRQPTAVQPQNGAAQRPPPSTPILPSSAFKKDGNTGSTPPIVGIVPPPTPGRPNFAAPPQ